MSETKTSPASNSRRLLQVLIIVASLMLVLLLAVGALAAVAVHQRLLPPPAFSVRLGPYELRGPCPGDIVCDKYVPYYALWWREPKPNGGGRYHEFFFVYLKPNRPH